MGKTITQFRRLCCPLSYLPILRDNSDLTNSSISSLSTEDCQTLILITVSTDQAEKDEEEDRAITFSE